MLETIHEEPCNGCHMVVAAESGGRYSRKASVWVNRSTDLGVHGGRGMDEYAQSYRDT